LKISPEKGLHQSGLVPCARSTLSTFFLTVEFASVNLWAKWHPKKDCGESKWKKHFFLSLTEKMSV
jgi:hypothetical protein